MGPQLFYLSLMLIVCSTEQIRVLRSNSSLATFKQQSGAELQLRSSPIQGMKKLTICGRLYIYQFHQSSCFLGLTAIDANTNINLISPIHRPISKRSFKIEQWNSLCITENLKEKVLKIFLNGNKIASKKSEYFMSYFKNGENLTFMGERANGEEYFSDCSVFGAMTDLNIWNFTMTASDVKAWTNCKMKGGGNVVSWSKASWISVGIEEVMIDMKTICKHVRKPEQVFLSSEHKMEFDNTIQYCRGVLHGEMAVMDNASALEMMSVLLRQPKCHEIYTGYTDREHEGLYVNALNGAAMEWGTWYPGGPRKLIAHDDCAVFNRDNLIRDKRCDKKMCPICSVPSHKIFVLRGLCQHINVNNHYLLMPGGFLMGWSKSKIAWANDDKQWVIYNTVDMSTQAYTNDTDGFPIGTFRWYFTNFSCTDPNQHFRTLLLHLDVKQPGYFCCDHGKCINSEGRCDKTFNCDDKTDEKNCEMVQLNNEMYNREQIPPIQYGINTDIHNTNIEASATVLEILDINESNSIFSLMFFLSLEWRDVHVTFMFLKNDQEKNRIEEKTIWFPHIKFSVLQDLDKTAINYQEITVRKTGNATLKDGKGILHPIEAYEGSENLLQMMIQYQNAFFCSFANIGRYPFDEEECEIQFRCSEVQCRFVNLNPGKLKIIPESFGQYHILSEKSTLTQKKKNGLTIKIKLGRNIIGIFLVTYLPTILMNIINQATNYVQTSNKYEFIITVNITCMMVLSGIYLSVSTSLPATATIKPIEVWLIFNLAYPFLVIVINIILQVKEFVRSFLILFLHFRQWTLKRYLQ